MNQADKLEKLGGNPVVGTAIATLGNYFPEAALGFGILSTLLTSAAGTRQANRIQAAIQDLESQVQKIECLLGSLTDEQYKVACETLLAINKATHKEKIDFLKLVFIGVIQEKDVAKNHAYTLSRIVRDISPPEFSFIVEYFGPPILMARGVSTELERTEQASLEPRYRFFEPTMDNEELIAGLLALGILVDSQKETPAYEFTPICAKLMALVKKGETPI